MDTPPWDKIKTAGKNTARLMELNRLNYIIIYLKNQSNPHRPQHPPPRAPHHTIQPQVVFRPQLPPVCAKAIKNILYRVVFISDGVAMFDGILYENYRDLQENFVFCNRKILLHILYTILDKSVF